jgi:hypothetical protein
MATFKVGFGFTDVRGSVGNNTFSIQKSGIHTIRNKAPAIANPQSASQMTIRCNLANSSKIWADTLTQDERNGWNTWALTKPGMGDGDGGITTIIKGNGGIMSGFNAFLLANQWLRTIGLGQVTVAPVGATPPTPPLSVAASQVGNNVVVTWTIPQTFKSGARVRVWLNKHQVEIHRQLIDIADPATGTFTLINVRGAGGAWMPIIDSPGDYLIQMDTVDPDGTKSGPSNVTEVTVI